MIDNDAPAQLTRRALLSGTASVLALSAASRFWPVTAALAKPHETIARSKLPPFEPYLGATASGPSSATVPAVAATPSVPGAPYIVPLQPGWSVISLITAGNTARSGYRMTGIPDGLGAFGNGDGTITVLMNHELSAGKSVQRGHGGRGAFVSRWLIDIASLEVIHGSDMVTSPADLHLWSGSGWKTAKAILAAADPKPDRARDSKPATARTTLLRRADVDLDRLCSADAAPRSAFYDAQHGIGYDGHILLNGEETEDRRGRAFAWVDATRACWELPAFAVGKHKDKADPPAEWENLLANPASGLATVVMANSDGGPSRIYVYLGKKQQSGSAVDRAGLTNGRLYSLKIAGHDNEDRETAFGLTKSPLGQGKGHSVSLVPPGKGTSFLRPEDGCWHASDANVYFFATTDRNDLASPDSAATGPDAGQVGRSRLWAVTFDDVTRIDSSGAVTARIELLLDGTEGGDMFDNITIDRNGIVYLCEDTGEARHNNKIWAYDTRDGTFTAITRFDPALFGDVSRKIYASPKPPFIDDKETSGILDVTALFEPAPWFRDGSTVLLASVQPHFGYDGASAIGRHIYEGGQLVLLVKAPA